MSNYDQDFYGWTQEQAAFLKAGRFNELDIENMIEEVESMGRSEYRTLQSRLSVLLVHLLKWQYQPIRQGRSWQLTIKEQRIKYLQVLKNNPGIKHHLDGMLVDAYELARVKASNETGMDEDTFPKTCPWSLNEITDSDFFPK